MTKGIEIEQQRQSNITQYNLDLKNVTDRLLVYEEKRKELEKEGLKLTSEDTKEIENLKIQQDNIKKQIEENTNVYNIALTEGSEALQGIIGNMFSGAGDAAADSLRDYFSKVFGVLVAALEKEIQGVVVRLLLEWLGTSPEPFWIKMGLIPVMNATIGGAIRAITNPLIESVLSFSTGGDITGRYDTPTLLQVGDASRLGGSNREWIFRDEQLQQTVQVAVASSNRVTEQRLQNIENLLSGLNIETKLSGEDILLSLKRSQHRMNARRI